MSEQKFSRRRRGGMRFRPSGGLGQQPQKNDRDATEARAAATAEQQGGPEKVYERRHAGEIERAENIAAGLPPEGVPPTPVAEPVKKEFREPNMETPAEVEEEKFAPVEVKEQPKGLVETIRCRLQPCQKSSTAHQARKKIAQGSHHQRGDFGNARGGFRGRQAGGIQH